MLKRWWIALAGLSLFVSFQTLATKYVPIAVGDITIIIPIDEAPVASSETITVLEDSTTVLNVLANDTDELIDQVQLTIAAPTNLSSLNGSLVQNGNDLTYTPAPNEFGQNYDSFSYFLTDVEGNTSETVTVLIHVTGVNDPPVSSQGSSWTYYMNEDAAGSFLGTYSFSDVENDPLEVVNVTANVTSVKVHEDRTSIEYRTKANYNGFDTMSVYVSDGTDITRLDWNLVIRPKSDLPEISPILKQNGNSLEVRVEMIDPEAKPLKVTFDIDPESSGATNFQPQTIGLQSSLADKYVYTHNYTGLTDGDYSFELTVIDNDDITMDTIVVPFSIDSVNDAPTANADVYYDLEAGETSSLQVTSNDGDIDSSNFVIEAIVQAPGNGNVQLSADKKSIIYTASSSFFGKDELQYTIKDDQGATSQAALVELNVDPAVSSVSAIISDFATSKSMVMPNQTVRFYWSKPADLPSNHEYRVAISDSVSITPQGAPSGVTSNEFIDMSFSEAETYKYAVKVCIKNTSDCGTESNNFTLTVADMSVSGLKALPSPAKVLTPVTVSWDPVSIPNVFYRVEADRPTTEGYVWDVLEERYTSTSRTRSPGQLGVYTYRVSACTDEMGCGSPSDVEVTMSSTAPVTVTYEYNALGRLVRVVDGANGTTDYQFDDAGNRTSVTESNQ